MHRRILIALAGIVSLGGCAIVTTTDVTDATFKRHQSVAVLGWPMYTRITDRENSPTTRLAIRPEERDDDVQEAELLARPIEPAYPLRPAH
jgi:hypothetical protein